MKGEKTVRVCIVAEGSYPYVVGGVSSWIHNLIKAFPNLEFVILAIVANREHSGDFVYELPSNVTEVHELYLQDEDWGPKRWNKKKTVLKKKEYQALRSLILNSDVKWNDLFDMFRGKTYSVEEILMGEDFYRAVQECYEKKYPQIIFADFLWTMRSIYLPLFLTMKMEIPEADLYHCVVTGYAGVLGSMAKHFYGSRVIISEHGIYTREREEELISAGWVQGIYKDIWIEQFKKMSSLAYANGDLVTSLYEHARDLQMELGCPIWKTRVTPNGIPVENYADIPGPTPEDMEHINVGAIVRVTPIKDVKTMIQAFGYAHQKNPKLKLWIMGPCDEDEQYAQECFELVEMMGIPDVVFTGRIRTADYLGRMDMTILTSISEGQPLTILESYAAKKPVIATDVGNCYGLIYGEDDDFGQAGILTHIMNVEEISQSILVLAADKELRDALGENGYRRVMAKYKLSDMHETYRAIYRESAEASGIPWSEEPFELFGTKSCETA
jgi:glycosyltransferase involved in cell wall biosynthesis